jgi:hypothetical protein
MNTRWIPRTGLLAAALLLTSCDKDIAYDYSPSPAAAQVDAIKLLVGTQTVTVYKNGKVTLGPLSYVRPNIAVTASLLDAQGNVIANPNENEVRVNMGIESGASGTFTRINGFSGTLSATAAGTSSFAVSLFDGVKHRIAFGPYYVSVVVR